MTAIVAPRMTAGEQRRRNIARPFGRGIGEDPAVYLSGPIL